MNDYDMDDLISDVAANVLKAFGAVDPDAFLSGEDHEAATRLVADEVEAVLASRPGLAAAPAILADVVGDEIPGRIYEIRPSWAREVFRPFGCGCCPGGDYRLVLGDRPAVPQGWTLDPRPLF